MVVSAKNEANPNRIGFTCDPDRILTYNRWSRNPVLYTVELRSQLTSLLRQMRASSVVEMQK